jgi:hypothetical protein
MREVAWFMLPRCCPAPDAAVTSCGDMPIRAARLQRPACSTRDPFSATGHENRPNGLHEDTHRLHPDESLELRRRGRLKHA